MKSRLDKKMLQKSIVTSRSQAENYIKLGLVKVDGKVIKKPGFLVSDAADIIVSGEQYVSRAALKLESISEKFALDFRGKTVLDVGSSTGGFTEFALRGGAEKVYAVDVGSDQLHPSLRINPKISLHEKTDIRDFAYERGAELRADIDMVVADVSFVSLRGILPAVKKIVNEDTIMVIMCKPQFEAGKSQINKGVIKNGSMRRKILQEFEQWLVESKFSVLDKADSQVAGVKGNVERFYKLRVSK